MAHTVAKINNNYPDTVGYGEEAEENAARILDLKKSIQEARTLKDSKISKPLKAELDRLNKRNIVIRNFLDDLRDTKRSASGPPYFTTVWHRAAAFSQVPHMIHA